MTIYKQIVELILPVSIQNNESYPKKKRHSKEGGEGRKRWSSKEHEPPCICIYVHNPETHFSDRPARNGQSTQEDVWVIARSVVGNATWTSPFWEKKGKQYNHADRVWRHTEKVKERSLNSPPLFFIEAARITAWKYSEKPLSFPGIVPASSQIFFFSPPLTRD